MLLKYLPLLLQYFIRTNLIVKVQSVAPGDEDQLCVNLRMNGLAPMHNYSSHMSILMDSYNYLNLIILGPNYHLGAWQQVDNDEAYAPGIFTFVS